MNLVPEKLIQTEDMTLHSEIYEYKILFLMRMNYHIIWK
jgi:hypothetical protein